MALPIRSTQRGLPPGLVAAFVLLVLIGIGAGLVWWASRSRKLAHDAPGFTPVAGTVLATDFIRTQRTRGPGTGRYRVLIDYAYEVGGRRYTSDVVSALPPEFPTTDEGQAWLDSCNVRIGGPIDVFHDPANPGRAVLMTDTPPEFEAKMREYEIGGWVVLGVAAVLTSTVLGVPGLRRKVLG